MLVWDAMPQCTQINHDEQSVRFLYVKYHQIMIILHFDLYRLWYRYIYIYIKITDFSLQDEGILYVIYKYYKELLSSYKLVSAY